MGVAPWLIDDDERITPYEWSNRVLAVMNAEAEAAEYHRNKAVPKAKTGRR